MIKLGPMKIGIRKRRFHQFDLRWGDTLVDGWDSFVRWVHAQRLARLLFSETYSPEYSGGIRDIDQYRRLMDEALAGSNSHTVIIDKID